MHDAPEAPSQMPSPTQQSWGALISIIIIVLMIVVGAFYSWERRVAEGRQSPSETSTQSEAVPVSP